MTTGTEKRAPERGDQPASDVDWGSSEKLRKASGLWIALWFLVPLTFCLIYGYVTR